MNHGSTVLNLLNMINIQLNCLNNRTVDNVGSRFNQKNHLIRFVF